MLDVLKLGKHLTYMLRSLIKTWSKILYLVSLIICRKPIRIQTIYYLGKKDYFSQE